MFWVFKSSTFREHPCLLGSMMANSRLHTMRFNWQGEAGHGSTLACRSLLKHTFSRAAFHQLEPGMLGLIVTLHALPMEFAHSLSPPKIWMRSQPPCPGSISEFQPGASLGEFNEVPCPSILLPLYVSRLQLFSMKTVDWLGFVQGLGLEPQWI